MAVGALCASMAVTLLNITEFLLDFSGNHCCNFLLLFNLLRDDYIKLSLASE
jgi:hypothetical protein